ncbi:sodium-dependent transporter [Halobaculum sp. MBLA0147]|uniref:sodium-dependent transporter n=1 Tax=Halobaculum sp. MBLA0147 TaxID=3079934 RepID=UPI003525DAF9
MTTERWSSQFGFVLATVGAAVGLGNVWRFSAVVGQNGGGAYLVPYLAAVVLCAVPMLVLELGVGRRLRTDLVSAFGTVGREYRMVGWAVLGGVLLLASYYLVLTGWVLGFFVGWLGGARTTFAAFVTGWTPVAGFLAATAITGVVVSGGVRSGIERLTTVAMPTAALLLVGLAVYGATLSGWDTAVAFLFTPRLAALTDLGVWSAAFGQVFFSMSVGQGVMLTYGSYVTDETDLLESSVVVVVADVAAALVAGLVVFPIVFSFGLQPTLGTELAFTTLPTAFRVMPLGRLVAVCFFGLLALAALSSSVALLEVGVAAAETTTRLSRSGATALTTAGVVLAGVPSALSYSPVGLTALGRPVLDVIDESVGTFALPLSALCLVAVFVWVADDDATRSELGRLFPAVKYLIPTVLVVVVAARAGGVTGPAWRLLLGRASGDGVAVVVAVLLAGLAAAVAWLSLSRLRRTG